MTAPAPAAGLSRLLPATASSSLLKKGHTSVALEACMAFWQKMPTIFFRYKLPELLLGQLLPVLVLFPVLTAG